MAAPKNAQELPFGVALVFTALGGLGLAIVLVWIAVASWVTFAYRPAAATVIERRLNRHPGNKGGATYRLQALLAYQVDGQEYRTWFEWPNSTRHSSGPEADAVLNQLQPGQEVPCFHDPLDPATAVLDRNCLSWGMLPGIAISSLFLLAGLGGLIRVWPTTFPRGLRDAAVTRMRRTPKRFYLWAGAFLAVVVATIGTLYLAGAALGGGVVVVIIAAILAGVGTGWPAWRYAAITMASPEKRAARAAGPPRSGGWSKGLSPAAAWNRIEPIAVVSGARLRVRLKANLASDALVQAGIWGFVLAVGLVGFVLTALVPRPPEGYPAPGRGALMLLSMVLGGCLVFGLGRRLWQRLARLTLEVAEHPLRAGSNCHLCIDHHDRTELQRLRLELVCEEVRHAGKSGKRHIACRLPVPLHPSPDRVGARHAQLQVPANLPGSFRLECHEVRWYLETGLGPWIRWKIRYPVMVEPGSSCCAPPSHPSSVVRLEDGPVSLWLEGESAWFGSGDMVRGGYAVRPVDGNPLRTIELSVLWRAPAPGSSELGVCHYEEHTAREEGEHPVYGTHAFHTRLPEGPLSYEGQVVIIRWAVRLRLRYVNGDERVCELPFRLAQGNAPRAN